MNKAPPQKFNSEDGYKMSEDYFTAFPPELLLSAIIPFHCTTPQSTSPILFHSAFRTNRIASM
jgi:hypothetical protein